MTTSVNGKRRSYRHVLVSVAVALGVAFGSYGIASAASGSGSSTTTKLGIRTDQHGARRTTGCKRFESVGQPAKRRDCSHG